MDEGLTSRGEIKEYKQNPLSEKGERIFYEKERGPTLNHRKVESGKHKGKWVYIRTGQDIPAEEMYVLQKPKETKSQFFKRIETEKTGRFKKISDARVEELKRVRKNVDNWTQTWVKKNIGKYDGVRDHLEFKKDLANAWGKEIKKNPTLYKPTKGGKPLQLQISEGLPNVSPKGIYAGEKGKFIKN